VENAEELTLRQAAVLVARAKSHATVIIDLMESYLIYNNIPK